MKNKKSPTILIVDDNEINIDILLGALNKYDIIAALSGQEALDIVKKEKVDLILLDIMMPSLDGYEVCRILKNSDKYSNIPIIFLTAKNETDDIKKGFEYGAIDYIVKPFNPSELDIRLNTHLELLSYKNNLEQKVATAIEENKINQQILFQKSKQAEIGELLMHISHQWKQPLSELGSINTFQEGKLEHSQMIDIEEYKRYLEKNGQIISFMAETMKTFQNFYQPNQLSGYFNVSEAVNIAINIVAATFNYNNIELDTIEDENLSKILGNQNEYAQIILSILNNAKNIFVRRKIDNPKITISIINGEDTIIVTIVDNGGGIVTQGEDIFAPYVSSSDSTGIGLYLVKAICKKNSWDIEGNNEKNGAKFILTSKKELESE
ncbi:MAG: response regulator [Arcobacteraceae bacterium]|nr:response regulator [Arcobacteraceae bacterium]